MKKRVLSVVAGTLLFCGCAANPADKTPAATVNSPAPAATTSVEATVEPPAMEGTAYSFSETAEVMFVGSKVTGSHSGGFKKVMGGVTVPEGGLASAKVDITIDMASIYSDNEDLTKHLSGADFFDVEKFGETTFKSTALAQTETGFEVTGDLSLHGVTKSITFPAEIAVDGDMLTAKAEFDINRKDFDIVYAGKPDDLIRDEVVIKFDLQAKKG